MRLLAEKLSDQPESHSDKDKEVIFSHKFTMIDNAINVHFRQCEFLSICISVNVHFCQYAFPAMCISVNVNFCQFAFLSMCVSVNVHFFYLCISAGGVQCSHLANPECVRTSGWNLLQYWWNPLLILKKYTEMGCSGLPGGHLKWSCYGAWETR